METFTLIHHLRVDSNRIVLIPPPPERETGFEANNYCCCGCFFQIVRLVSRILMLSNGVKVVFEKCGCSHEVGGILSTCTCIYVCTCILQCTVLCMSLHGRQWYFCFQLLKSLTALLNKLIEVPKSYYKLSQFSQHE